MPPNPDRSEQKADIRPGLAWAEQARGQVDTVKALAELTPNWEVDSSLAIFWPFVWIAATRW